MFTGSIGVVVDFKPSGAVVLLFSHSAKPFVYQPDELALTIPNVEDTPRQKLRHFTVTLAQLGIEQQQADEDLSALSERLGAMEDKPLKLHLKKNGISKKVDKHADLPRMAHEKKKAWRRRVFRTRAVDLAEAEKAGADARRRDAIASAEAGKAEAELTTSVLTKKNEVGVHEAR